MADDRYDTYYAEKIWELVPPYHRHEDGIADNAGVLREFVEVMAEQAAQLRRSIDRLWEDQSIEWCDDWVVPYIGDLFGTRLVSALNLRGRRVDVFKTFYYRRRIGTLAVLEELIADIAGWEGTVVEELTTLARTLYRLDAAPTDHLGRFSGTPTGGIADLRDPLGAMIVDGSFDEYHHTPDVRRARARGRGRRGRHGIPKLSFHLLRLGVRRNPGVTAALRDGDAGFTFDPSGRDIPLFMPRSRPQDPDPIAGGEPSWDVWRPALPWERPAPMKCRLLAHAVFVFTDSALAQLAAEPTITAAQLDELRALSDRRFPTESQLRTWIGTLPSAAALLDPIRLQPIIAATIQDECGRRHLYPTAVEAEEAANTSIAMEAMIAGYLGVWTVVAPDSRVVIDPERGRFLFQNGPPTNGFTVTYHDAFSGDIGAGTYDRRDVEERVPTAPEVSGGGTLDTTTFPTDGVVQIADSRTYRIAPDPPAFVDLVLQAANQTRPYLELDETLTFTADPAGDARLVLSGIWIGAVDAAREIVLDGEFEEVTVENTTLDPGGARSEDPADGALDRIVLVVEGHVEHLRIVCSITGPIVTRGAGVIERLTIEDSIVQSTAADPVAFPAIDVGANVPAGDVVLDRVTVFGGLLAHRLWADAALLTHVGIVADLQHGCFRYSTAPPESELPRRYESPPLDRVAGVFTSRRFGHPGYAQLSAIAPELIRQGAENRSEIGAFNALIEPIRRDSLRAKIDEFMPFALVPILVDET